MTDHLNESTLYQNIEVPQKKALSTLSIDSTGYYAALGGYGYNNSTFLKYLYRKKGLYILDLEEPWDSPKHLQSNLKQSNPEINVVRWNPHTEKANLIASSVSIIKKTFLKLKKKAKQRIGHLESRK